MMAKRKAGKPRGPGGRPKGTHVYDLPTIKAEVLKWIAEGDTLLKYCEQPGKPDRQTILNWMDEDEEFARHYKASREKCHEAMLERCQNYANMEPETPVQATWRKYQIDTHLKILRMVNPARYGEKVNVDHNGGIQITLLTGVPDEED